jgi:hypothetical protein
VTATAKPAVTPVADRLGAGDGLGLVVCETGTALSADSLRLLLDLAGYQVLQQDDLGEPSGRGWTELGDIDSFGHQYGWKVARQVGREARALAARIADLLAHGWQEVTVITDHGWLLLPDGLPKVDLPEHLTEVRKGRCARLKPLSNTDGLSLPWSWDPNVSMAFAAGIACYQSGQEWEHGGISPQELVVPVLRVRQRGTGRVQVSITGVTWHGLRCIVSLSGAVPAPAGVQGLQVDIRSKAADANTSLATEPKHPREDGTVSLVVPDDSRLGQAAFIVVLDSSGAPLAQTHTTVGG